MRAGMRFGVVVTAVAVIAAACGQGPVPPPAAVPPGDPSIAALLGDDSRAKLETRIVTADRPWTQWVAWGERLFYDGFVDNPPLGSSPSPRISEFYTCARCHNTAREDPVLTDQDPEARFRYILAGHPKLFMTQGTTMWGAANRVAFYNDYYALYHDLCVPDPTTETQTATGGPDDKGRCAPGTRKMDPASLEDAIQVCSGYCSVGRYLVRWELDAMVAYYWSLELHLSDLGLTADEDRLVRGALMPLSLDTRRVDEARTLLRSRFLLAAGDTARTVPELRTAPGGTVELGPYPDGREFTGDPARGGQLFARTCAHCHGTVIYPVSGGVLGSDVERFFEVLAKGTVETDAPYMPEFTTQRLSRQQSADILAYLQKLLKEGR
jgi:mono/diheme cytochrome c family protein